MRNAWCRVSERERYGTRDLAFSAYHRTLPADWGMIDIDGCLYCRRCNAVLALIETAQDVGQKTKATTITCALSGRAGIPTYLIFYKKNGDGSFGSHVVYLRYPTIARIGDDWREVEEALRRNHSCSSA